MSAPRSAVARPLNRRRLFAFWILLAALWFLPLNQPHLFDPDEGRYAEIPREMVASGDWVTPRLNALKYFEKPALQYWSTAAAFELFGMHAWTVRLWPAVSGFLGLLLTWALAYRLYDERSALLAVLVQASALLYVAMARIATLDMSLSFSLQLAMTALVLLARRGPSGGGWRLALLLGTGVALAVLSKGLVGILIPGAVAVLFVLLHRDWRLLLRMQPWWALLVLLLIAAPWFILASVRNPEFAHFFFVVQHFQRYLSSAGFDRYQPVWFFVWVVAVGFLPWSVFVADAVRTAWREARAGDRAASMLLIWAGFVFAFFSLSQSKLMPYVLPMFPAISVLTGRAIAQLPLPKLTQRLRAVMIVAFLIVVALLLLWLTPLGASLVARASPTSITGFVIAFALLTAGAAVGVHLAARASVIGAVFITALGSMGLAESALLAADYLPRMQRVVDLAQHLGPALSPDTHLYCVNEYVQPIPFYMRRPCTLVGYRGELDFGLTQEPQLGIADLKGFIPDWRQQADAVAILRPQDYQELEALGVPMSVIYTAKSYVVVARK